jgi:hypothetical protein
MKSSHRRGVEFSVNPFCSGFCESNIFDFSLSANLIRRLFQIGISKQSILLFQNLYQNAKSS